MRHDQFRILTYTADEHLARDVADRIRAHLAALPVTLEFESSARRAVSEYRLKLHDLVILAAGTADAEIVHVILQLQSISGSSRILYLGSKPLPADIQGVDTIEFPIVKWDILLDQVLGAVPENLAIRYRIPRLEGPLRKSLQAYAARTLRIEKEEQAGVGVLIAPLVLRSVTSGAGTGAGPEKPGAEGAHGQATGTSYVFEQNAHRHSLKLELMILAVLLGAALASHYFADPDVPSGWLSLKSVLTLLACVGLFGFMASRGMDRYFFSRLRNENGD